MVGNDNYGYKDNNSSHIDESEDQLNDNLDTDNFSEVLF